MIAILLVIGLILLVVSADWLVDGASSIARRAGISEFVIGLTIVGFGTSCPELVVSLTGALEGNADVSIGNVAGSNIFNVLMILGLTALFSPLQISRRNAMRDIPVTLLVSFLFVALGMDGGVLSRIDAVVFLLCFIFYIWFCFKTDRIEDEEQNVKNKNIWLSLLLVIAGLVGLVVGGRLLVDNAVRLARLMGASDKFIAVTLLAGGTSLPELATCIVAAAKQKGQLALGNILGSNVFNILLILGCSALVTPLSFSGIDMVDTVTLLLSVTLLWMTTYTGKRNRLDRWEGLLLLVCNLAYMVWLVLNLGD